MKKLLILFLGLILFTDLFAGDTCKVHVNLVNVIDDRVKVTLFAPGITSSTIEYVMPAVIPGSYSKKDFGRFVKDFKAYNHKGKKLKVKRKETNVFEISKANTLKYIEYWVDDTWDAPNENFVFQPGGTNIEKPSNFVINHQGFYGYFEGFKMNPYSIRFEKNPDHFAFTALPVNRFKEHDIVEAPSYVKLVDNPIMFCRPDTTSFKVSNMTVHIGVYSATGKIKSDDIKNIAEKLAVALGDFFGTLPVDDYYFIMYFPRYAKEGITNYGGFGALEHSYCSFYFLPEIPSKEQLQDIVESVAGHEFLHILTPLNIHSEEIEFFDFRNPKMSQHLWLYEGVTEYFANLVRIRSGLIDEKGFIYEITDKIRNAENYPSVSFTEMSRNILTDQYKDMYNNVYQKGALIGFLLDIRLTQLSNGQVGLRELMLMLARKYGPSKPFKDDELIPEIVRLTYPQTEQFFKSYVQGNEPLPYEKYFGLIGWDYTKDDTVQLFSFGKVHFIISSKAQQVIAVESDEKLNKFGIRSNDLLIAVNGNQITTESDSLIELIESPENDSEVTVTVLRGSEKITAKGIPELKKERKKHFIRKFPELTAEQQMIRRKVFNR